MLRNSSSMPINVNNKQDVANKLLSIREKHVNVRLPWDESRQIVVVREDVMSDELVEEEDKVRKLDRGAGLFV